MREPITVTTTGRTRIFNINVLGCRLHLRPAEFKKVGNLIRRISNSLSDPTRREEELQELQEIGAAMMGTKIYQSKAAP